MKRHISTAIAAFAVMAYAGVAQAAYKEVSVVNGGTITGKVLAGSAAAKSQSFTISKDPEICGSGTREWHQVRVNGGALIDAVVYLEKVKEGKPFAEGVRGVTIDQQKCEFVPYLSTMVNGGTLTATNSDGTLHNIHAYELIGRARRTVLNVSQPEKGNVIEKEIKLRRGVAMKVECDAHDFMHAYVFVAENPYFAVVGEDGSFTIGDVPPGKYTIKTWHGYLGEKEGAVEVSAGGTATVEFSY